ALQKPAAKSQPVGKRARSLVKIPVWRHRLRIEVIESRILQRMRSIMEAPGQSLVGGNNGIELRERVERPGSAETLSKGQRIDFVFAEQVFRPFQKVQAVGDQGPAKIKSGRGIPYSLEVSASNKKIRQRIIQAVAPLLAAPPRIRRDHSRGEAPVLCQVGHL